MGRLWPRHAPPAYHGGMRRLVRTAGPLIPPQPTLASLREAAAACRACPLWKRGTQTVFGEGRAGARVLFVGEQPGNAEDLAGHSWTFSQSIADVDPREWGGTPENL